MSQYLDRYTFAAAVLLALLLVGIAHTAAQARSPLNIAQSYVGTNPTNWSHNWCGKFADLTLRKAGKPGGGNLARGYATYGRPSACRPGAIAVMAGHIGFVTACHGDSVSIISGNHSGKSGHRTVGPGRYRMSRIISFRWP